MLDMKTASVRHVQHHLAEVLRWVEEGEEVEITRRNRAIARIVPARAPSREIPWPDFVARAAVVWGKRAAGKPVSRIIIEEREERR